jgi:hypothetical protein
MLGAAALAVGLATAARADLVHKYTFNNNTTNDSVGTAHGVLVDRTGIATYTGGSLNLTANAGNSGQDFNNPATVGAFVDLPNNIFTDAVLDATGTGVLGQISLEMWFTVQEHKTWAEAFVFGTSSGGEGISDNGDNQSYVAFIPRSGPNDIRGTTRNGANNVEVGIPVGAPPALNQRHHVVMTLDALDVSAGPNGTAKVYLNNGTPAVGAIQPPIDSMTNNNNWLGRSLWGGDPLFDGLIDEFRIYNSALTASQVSASFTTGPDPAPVPVLVVNRSLGTISLANQTSSSIQVKGYSIGSASGSLNPAGWASIDAGNIFDPNGGWTTSSLTATSIAESNTVGPSFDGGAIPANQSAGIGSPWLKTPFQDLTFSFTLGDGTTGTGVVQYTGTAPLRSDLNGDGNVNAADWALFVPNSFTTFAADLPVVAYRKGDLDGDKDNDFADFKLFKSDFIQFNGLAAFNALVGVVPEPGTATLAVVAAAAMCGSRRRRAA